MKVTMRFGIIFSFFLTLVFHVKAQQSYDVVVYGATPSGIAAAVNAAREGMRVGLFEPTDHFGGMITSGMSNTDFKTFESLGGTYLEFMQRVEKYYTDKYGAGSQQVEDCYRGAWYEPHVAKKVLHDMIKEAQTVELFLSHRLANVLITDHSQGKKLEGIVLKTSDRDLEVRATVFIDATYEGDLMALSGCDYRVGRESRSEYGELFAGVKYYQGGKLLIGSTGKGDHKIQCYNYRICASNDRKNFVRIEKPRNYNREEYLPLLEMIRSGKITAFEDQVVKIRRIPNGKADINDLLYSPVSLRLPGENYRWPEGTWEERREIAQRHKDYSLGLLYFLQNDAGVPASIKNEVSQWGLPKDEFKEYGHFPPMLYIREGRRLKGNFVLTEHDTQPAEGILRAPVHPDAIAICDYSMDSHGNALAGNLHPNVTEGVFNRYVQPYQIPYRVILPADVDGLLVSCAVSATHVAFSSLRMEPTWTAIGQAAGIAAAISVKSGKTLRAIPVEELQRKLHLQGAKTIYVRDTEPGDTHFMILQYFGTKGFFHRLPEHENQPYTGRGSGEGIRGQHIQAYPFHESNHHLALDSTLADKWWKMAKLGGEVMPHQGLTRLQFLQELHRRLTQ